MILKSSKDGLTRLKLCSKTGLDGAKGRSGFKVDGMDKAVRVYTTRPDTIYGVTYVVIAPEHPVVKELIKGTETGTGM